MIASHGVMGWSSGPAQKARPEEYMRGSFGGRRFQPVDINAMRAK
jgi:hypothetical protein